MKDDLGTNKKGMNRTGLLSEVSSKQYTFALNANNQDVQDNSSYALTNEPSNIKCVTLEGKKVLKHMYDRVRERIYLFMYDPSTDCSEIGYIGTTEDFDISIVDEYICKCDYYANPEQPLEDILQEDRCTYTQLVTDCCGRQVTYKGCLNFSYSHPILNVEIRRSSLGDELYWNDGYNPDRYLKLYDIQSYYQDKDDCTGEITETCLDCEKLRVFELFKKPCIDIVEIGNGGALRAGWYTIIVAYCTIDGTVLTDYVVSNPVNIFDKNRRILDQTQLDYVTDKTIKVKFNGLDEKFDNYIVVVQYKTGNDTNIGYKNYGIYPINQNTVNVTEVIYSQNTTGGSSEQVESNSITVNDVMSVRPTYKHSSIMSVADNRMFLGDLKSQRTINLQPVVNLMGAFVEWGTGGAYEELYEHGESNAKYKGYMRGETYPLSIKFTGTQNFQSNLFPFIGRPPETSELEDISSGSDYTPNYDSFENARKTCGDTNRIYKWQYVDTATVEGNINCTYSSPEETTVEVEETVECLSDEYVIEDGTIEMEGYDINGNIATWINEGNFTCPDSGLSDICDALTNMSHYNDCTPDVGECELLDKEQPVCEVIAVDSDGVEIEDVADTDEIGLENVNFDCLLKLDIENETATLNQPLADDIEDFYNLSSGTIVAYDLTNYTGLNSSSCGGATGLLSDLNFTTGIYLENKHKKCCSCNTSQSLLTTIDASKTNQHFHDKLHSNVIWWKLDLTQSTVMQLLNSKCSTENYIHNNSIRVTIYDGCPTSGSEVTSYSKIISDISNGSDPNLLFNFTPSDFSGNSVYIALDSPMYTDVKLTLGVSGSSGGAGKVTIGGSDFNITWNTSDTQTATDFVTNNSSALASMGITVTSTGSSIEFDMSGSQYDSYIYTQTAPTLALTETNRCEISVLKNPCSCFGIIYRDVPTKRMLKYGSITFKRKCEYKVKCTYKEVTLSGCGISPDRRGRFSYVESGIKYPCNEELYDSSVLKIKPEDLPLEYRSDFQNWYSSGVTGGYYDLTTGANFMDKPIRHYKFPTNNTSEFIQRTANPNVNTVIYPIGFRIDNNIINSFLDVAVNNDLITAEERSMITGYEIFRGDRRTDRTVIAKGLLYDMLKYAPTGGGQETIYSNYPFNDTSPDLLNGVVPKEGRRSFSFQSPDIHFNTPTLPDEMYLDGYQIGTSYNRFSNVKNHAEWVLLGKKANDVADLLAGLEAGLDTLTAIQQAIQQAAQAGDKWVYAVSIVAGVAFTIKMASAFTFKRGIYKYQWLNTFRNFGNPYNFAYYGVAVGKYNSLKSTVNKSSLIRSLNISQYLDSGLRAIQDEIDGKTAYINNFEREDSVFIKTSKDIEAMPFKDNSRMNIPTPETGTLGAYKSNVASQYVTLQRYLPNQYGGINSIGWIGTGYCGDLSKDNSCDIIFGGDIFITRFAMKRKFPFFTSNAIDMPPNTPFKYSSVFNINNGSLFRGYLNYLTGDKSVVSDILGLGLNSDYLLYDGTMWNLQNIDEFYVTDKYKFLLFYYGFPYFLVESEVNCSYRYAMPDLKYDFYPHTTDIINYTQETNLSIREREYFFYNDVYSSSAHKRPYTMLPYDYNRKNYDNSTDDTNTVIVSDKEDEKHGYFRSPWLNYRAANRHNFGRDYGKLEDLKSIESEMIWARFTDGYSIINSFDPLAEKQTKENRLVGTGGILTKRYISFNNTDLGYAGTQHRTTISTQFGHYSVDAKRGKVFELQPGAKGMSEISLSMEKWFKEQLPFKILKYYPDVNVDDNYNGLGISMGWDDRTKRLFITKLDYIPVEGTGLAWESERGFYIGKESKGQDTPDTFKHIEYTDEEYFTPAHWTVAYCPIEGFQTWISYYSFYPNYYISLNSHFKTGINHIGDSKQGIWSHYPLLSSYQVFYGEKHPFIIEYSSSDKGVSSLISFVRYSMECKKYYNKYDFSNIFGKTFNKAYIYNDKENTGELRLNFSDGEDARDIIDYPKYNPNSIDILSSEDDGVFNFNYIFNHVANHKSHIPIWERDIVNVNKELNPIAIDYRLREIDRLRGNYFLIRLVQDQETRYKYTFKLSHTIRDYYQ